MALLGRPGSMWVGLLGRLSRGRLCWNSVRAPQRPWTHTRPCLAQSGCRGHQTLMAAPLPQGAGPSIRQVQAMHAERLVQVEWEDGSRSLYPSVWLRDNCQCPACTLQSAQARSLLVSQLDIDTTVDRVTVMEPTKVSIVWPDQHTSEFDADWLKRRCFSPEARRAQQEELFLNKYVCWGSDLQIHTASFEEVLQDDRAALDWLLALRRVGIAFLKGAPQSLGQVTRLSQRIGYLRMTFYGHTWNVQEKLAANNVAYTSGDLSLHTDYPALHHPPGVQFLHCITQAHQGGESEVVDGFHVANQLRRENPEAFRVLSSLLVNFTDTGADYCDFHVQSRNHIIDVDHEGQVVRINYNNATRDSIMDVPLEQVQHFYSSLKAYIHLMYQPANILTYKMEPGDVVTFDNWRLLHGRRSYASRPGNLRHLEGAYLDWDEVMSRLRILRKAVHGEGSPA
ncbi:gamma-butyrobetaine dioxygenase [Conger conger]|uniref:gamma-butyrobetaine dioxygenase n=1 Tax=Conger conger TaxID=82655 RepID=UPI002A5A146B|nr:gamma-butyrobetaine dioxygenase [Conger conger]